MKNVLVTGGAGFIGANFVRFLLDVEPDIRLINLDALTYAGNLENLESLSDLDVYFFIKGNIQNEEHVNQVFAQFEVDTVVHFAAESHVDRSILDPSTFVQTNIVGTFVLLEAARRFWDGDFTGKRFHHISSDEVFGSLTATGSAFTEISAYAPNSPYAASKASSDHLVRAYGHTYSLPVTLTNCSNNYGPYQYPEKLIPLAIMNSLQGKPLPVYGDGKQVRDWLYVIDHCKAVHKVLVEGKLGETYVVGGNNQLTNLQIVNKICQILDERLPKSIHAPHRNLIAFVKDRPGHDRRYAMDTSKINAQLGWEPEETISTGLEKTVEWYLSNQEWVEALRQRPEYIDWMAKNYTKR